MSSFSNMGEVEFELRYEQDGKKYKWTGTADATMQRDVEYGPIDEYYSRVYKTYEETKITLGHVKDLKGTVVGEPTKFFVEGMPEAPFDTKWALQRKADFRADSGEEANPFDHNQWVLYLTDNEGRRFSRVTIKDLTDEVIVTTAKQIVADRVSNARRNALRNGAVEVQ
jgi:hypothetical protein